MNATFLNKLYSALEEDFLTFLLILF